MTMILGSGLESLWSDGECHDEAEERQREREREREREFIENHIILDTLLAMDT